MQELPQPELQPLSLEAKAAAALVKYLPLPKHLLPATVATLQKGVGAPLWTARAAALVFAQACTGPELLCRLLPPLHSCDPRLSQVNKSSCHEHKHMLRCIVMLMPWLLFSIHIYNI